MKKLTEREIIALLCGLVAVSLYCGLDIWNIPFFSPLIKGIIVGFGCIFISLQVWEYLEPKKEVKK